MEAGSFLKGVYAVDTLDTRFTTPSSVPYKTTAGARKHNGGVDGGKRDGASSSKRENKPAEPPRGNTPEFYLYYAIVASAVLSMFWIAYGVSDRRSLLSVSAHLAV
jgi:hypothetical protein